MKAAFTKVSALLLNEKGKLLVVRGEGDDFYKAFGGKIEGNETDEECLSREVMEEGMVKLINSKLYLSPPLTPVENKPGLYFEVRFYIIQVDGEPKLNPEDNTVELRWISKEDFESNNIKVASALRLHAIPKLIEDRILK